MKNLKLQHARARYDFLLQWEDLAVSSQTRSALGPHVLRA